MALFEQLNLNKLSAVEQEIYRFIVNHLEKIPYMRVRDIADDAHVSSTSVFRFIQKVGFQSFPEFRFYIKNHLEKAHFDAHPEHLGLEARIKGLNMQIFHPDAEYQIRKLAEAMRDADLILFMGMGASGAIAQYVARKLASLGYFSISIDELTYPIHILIRYELEKEIFNGTADYDNLDTMWNDKYEEYLGIRPEHDRDGILQDMHSCRSTALPPIGKVRWHACAIIRSSMRSKRNAKTSFLI